MFLVTVDKIEGKDYEILGLVEGSVVQSKHIGKDFMAGLKTIIGGEIKGYTEMMEEARKIATDRMIEEAETLRADAIVSIRYSSAAVMAGACEIVVYGTAIRYR